MVEWKLKWDRGWRMWKVILNTVDWLFIGYSAGVLLIKTCYEGNLIGLKYKAYLKCYFAVKDDEAIYVGFN